jgi:hypothetical protein
MFFDDFFKKYIFAANAFSSPFQHKNNYTAMFFQKTSHIPWWDSNPGLLVPEADAMSTAPEQVSVTSCAVLLRR